MLLIYELIKYSFGNKDIKLINLMGSGGNAGAYKKRFANYADITYDLSLYPDNIVSNFLYFSRKTNKYLNNLIKR